jgi:hypothetical protein
MDVTKPNSYNEDVDLQVTMSVSIELGETY